jgi:hypothetical protein
VVQLSVGGSGCAGVPTITPHTKIVMLVSLCASCTVAAHPARHHSCVVDMFGCCDTCSSQLTVESGLQEGTELDLCAAPQPTNKKQRRLKPEAYLAGSLCGMKGVCCINVPSWGCRGLCVRAL